MSEIEVEFLGHACAAIRCGKTTIVTDPWLIGTAFLGGWQRKYAPPENWERILQTADLIYVSHAHSDHLSPETLKHAGDTPIVIPDFPRKTAERAALREGVKNVIPMRMGEWHSIRDVRWKIIPDNCPGHEDSGLIVEYKGKYLVNTVDCTMPNGLDLPAENVEWLLAPFAGGSSPYPVCYAPMYGSEKTEAIMKRNNDALLKKLTKLVDLTHPEKLMPFAGFYTETHEHFRKVNLHNSMEDISVSCEIVRPTLEPNPTVELPELLHGKAKAAEYFSGYDWSKRNLFITGEVEGVEMGVRGEPSTVLHVLNPDAFTTAMNRRLPIDELAIGYHCLMFRIPDVYEADFWDHFQNREG